VESKDVMHIAKTICLLLIAPRLCFNGLVPYKCCYYYYFIITNNRNKNIIMNVI